MSCSELQCVKQWLLVCFILKKIIWFGFLVVFFFWRDVFFWSLEFFSVPVLAFMFAGGNREKY